MVVIVMSSCVIKAKSSPETKWPMALKLGIQRLGCMLYYVNRGWSGGAMVLGKLPVPGRPTAFITVGQGPIALAVGAGGVVWTFLLSSILSLLFPLFGRRPDID